MNLKNLCILASNGWSDKSFTALLKILGDMLPDENELPRSCYQAKKLLCPLGLDVERIHACPNDCILYRNEYEKCEVCPTCGESRYKRKNQTDGNDDTNRKGPPAKVIWYFPVIPRFKRLFKNPKDAQLLRWHADIRKKDGKLRHPADSPQWRNIDRKFKKKFGDEPRNLRLGFSSDGVNPFGNMSSQHSTWPVLLCIYNIPPWLTMKRKYIMMSLLISGPKQPGNDIDVYLAPLIEDLKKLWCDGVQVWDAYSKENFNLRAMIFCTINDFPAYGNLSGYSNKGGKACPVCEDDTVDIRLKNCKKTVYMGHRRFLPLNHPYRKKKTAFNGEIEIERARSPLTSKQVYLRVKDIKIQFGKFKKKAAPKGETWKKRSIFWDLPYWEELQVRHCLDLMHIEKNVCESLVGLLLGIPKKTKDGLNARKDMVKMGIKWKDVGPELRKTKDGLNTRTYLPPAMYNLSKEEKKKFCQCLHSVKVPSGYSANIKKLVSMKDLKLIGMKSHDCHVLMTQMLPIAIRGILPEKVRLPILKLCFFFNAICSKVIDPESLDELQREVIVTLCEFEIYFPPSFFDIMVHLIVHLVHEIKLCGPVFLRYMYPFERYMSFLKGYVRNRYRPEGSIVEGYIAEEAIEWYNSYMADLEPIGIPKSRHEGRVEGVGTIGLEPIEADKTLHEKAHLLVLQHMTYIAPYINEVIRQSVEELADKSIKWLARGPTIIVNTYQAYDINGYTFYTIKQDGKSTNQSSGVTLVAISEEFSRSKDARSVHAKNSYYGQIEEIWELDYVKFKIPLFRCKWVDNRRGVQVDKYGFTIVDLTKLGYKNDPFILANQATQIFYVEDPLNSKRHIVIHGKRRIVGVQDVVDDEEFNYFEETPPFSIGVPSNEVRNDDIDDASYLRHDHQDGEYPTTPPPSQRRADHTSAVSTESRPHCRRLNGEPTTPPPSQRRADHTAAVSTESRQHLRRLNGEPTTPPPSQRRADHTSAVSTDGRPHRRRLN
ncbi:uncharacterized protein LOC144552481 [Carex rostrata]